MNQRTTWTDELSQWMIRRAATRAPESLSERLQEEWLADLSARSKGGSRLRFALGCCWATRVIAHEHQPATVRVAGTVVEAKLVLSNAQYTLGYFSRRSSTFFFVVMLHVVLFYVLVAKLSHTKTTLPPPHFVLQPVHQLIPKNLPPAPPPQIDHTIIKVDPPEFLPPVSDSGDRPTEVAVEPPGVPASLTDSQPPPPAHIVQRVSGGPGAGFPSAEDYYPDSAKRLGEQGSAVVQVCVDTKGRLTSDPKTLQGTGSDRLDEGALKLARAGSGHYRAATDDGQPVNACYPFRIRFQLRN